MYKISHYFLRIVGMIGLLMMVLGRIIGVDALGPIGLCVVVVAAMQRRVFFKCPYCKKRLPPRNGLPKKCPHCGKELD